MDDGKDIVVECVVCACFFHKRVGGIFEVIRVCRELRSLMFCVVSVNFNGGYIIFLLWCVVGLWGTYIVRYFITIFVVGGDLDHVRIFLDALA